MTDDIPMTLPVCPGLGSNGVEPRLPVSETSTLPTNLHPQPPSTLSSTSTYYLTERVTVPETPIYSILQMETPRFGEVTEVRAKCLNYKVTDTSGYDKDQSVTCSDIRSLGGFFWNRMETTTGQKRMDVL